MIKKTIDLKLFKIEVYDYNVTWLKSADFIITTLFNVALMNIVIISAIRGQVLFSFIIASVFFIFGRFEVKLSKDPIIIKFLRWIRKRRGD